MRSDIAVAPPVISRNSSETICCTEEVLREEPVIDPSVGFLLALGKALSRVQVPTYWIQ